MGDDYPRSRMFIGSVPEECWRKYHSARLTLTPRFDPAHYPTLDKFWLHEHGTYILVIIYDFDPTPNM